jgi:hypothetical protein
MERDLMVMIHHGLFPNPIQRRHWVNRAEFAAGSIDEHRINVIAVWTRRGNVLLGPRSQSGFRTAGHPPKRPILVWTVCATDRKHSTYEMA